MRPLSPMDSGFLTTETRQTPMHVGSLLLLRPPPGAKKDFFRELYADCIQERETRGPFDEKIVYPASRFALPHWDKDPAFDLEYHLRHSALPSPGRYRELFVLVSRLHGTLLDRTRPLWESHIIEGLETGQFGLYTKVHHAAIDGVGGMRLLQASLSEDPDERGIPYVWTRAADAQRKRSRPRPTPEMTPAKITEIVKNQLGTIPAVARALGHTIGALQRPADGRLALPFEGPRSILNTKISGARRFVAQSYALERVRRVGKAFDATVNDVVLAMVAGALRRYLEEFAGGAPDKPLTAMAPISIRPTDADDFGNAVSTILVNLGTHIADPVDRMTTIRASMDDGKTLIKEMTFTEVMLFTMIMAAPFLVPSLVGLGARFPSTNVVVSNVPGPQKTLYWNGAKMEGMYPASIVYHGLALNVTVTSYAGSLDFGIVACRRSVPRVQRVIDFLEGSLVELEDASGVS